MNFLNTIKNVIYSIVKAHLIICGILIISYIIEINTNFKLFIKHFQWKKSIRNAEIALDGHSVFYFAIVLIFFIYEIIKKKIDLYFFSIVLWLVIMICLLLIFRKYYNKHQGVDPTKADDDFT